MDDKRDEQERDENLETFGENGVLGRSISSAELREQEKRRKEQEKAERKMRRRSRKEYRNGMPREKNTTLWVMVGTLGAVVIAVGVMMAIEFATSGKDKAANSNEFIAEETALPEMSAEGIKGIITRAYYTNDKHFAVVLKLSNAYNTKHYLTSLEVKVSNGDGELIASGYTDSIEDFALDPESYGTFTFYISPKYVKIPDDSLENLTYEITTGGRLEDENATAKTDATTGTEATATTSAE